MCLCNLRVLFLMANGFEIINHHSRFALKTWRVRSNRNCFASGCLVSLSKIQSYCSSTSKGPKLSYTWENACCIKLLLRLCQQWRMTNYHASYLWKVLIYFTHITYSVVCSQFSYNLAHNFMRYFVLFLADLRHLEVFEAHLASGDESGRVIWLQLIRWANDFAQWLDMSFAQETSCH